MPKGKLNPLSKRVQELGDKYFETRSDEDFTALYEPLSNFFDWFYANYLKEPRFKDETMLNAMYYVWKRISSYNKGKASFVTWCRAIIFNAYRELYNKEKRLKEFFNQNDEWIENTYDEYDHFKHCDIDLNRFAKILDDSMPEFRKKMGYSNGKLPELFRKTYITREGLRGRGKPGFRLSTINYLVNTLRENLTEEDFEEYWDEPLY